VEVEDVLKAARSVHDSPDVPPLELAFDSLAVAEVDSSVATQVRSALGGIR